MALTKAGEVKAATTTRAATAAEAEAGTATITRAATAVEAEAEAATITRAATGVEAEAEATTIEVGAETTTAVDAHTRMLLAHSTRSDLIRDKMTFQAGTFGEIAPVMCSHPISTPTFARRY